MVSLKVKEVSIEETIIKTVKNTMLNGIGFIEDVHEDGTVLVKASFTDTNVFTRMNCKYLVPSSSEYSLSIQPKVDDIVIVFALQHKEDSMFEEPKTVVVKRKNGYTYLSCVCVPIGTIKNGAKVAVSADNGIYSVTASEIHLNEEGSNAARKGDKVKVIIPANTFLVSADSGVKNPLAVEVEGTIEEGSGTVFIGD